MNRLKWAFERAKPFIGAIMELIVFGLIAVSIAILISSL